MLYLFPRLPLLIGPGLVSATTTATVGLKVGLYVFEGAEDGDGVCEGVGVLMVGWEDPVGE